MLNSCFYRIDGLQFSWESGSCQSMRDSLLCLICWSRLPHQSDQCSDRRWALGQPTINGVLLSFSGSRTNTIINLMNLVGVPALKLPGMLTNFSDFAAAPLRTIKIGIDPVSFVYVTVNFLYVTYILSTIVLFCSTRIASVCISFGWTWPGIWYPLLRE